MPAGFVSDPLIQFAVSSEPILIEGRGAVLGSAGPQPRWGGDPFPATWGGIVAPHFERLAWLLASPASSVGCREYSPKPVPAGEVASSLLAACAPCAGKWLLPPLQSLLRGQAVWSLPAAKSSLKTPL